MPQRIEISYKTILFIFGFLGLLWFLNQIKDILLFFFVAFLVMSALKPLVDRLEKLKIPRVLAVIFVYFLIISFFVTIGSVLIPVMIQETTRLLRFLPNYFDQAVRIFNFNFQTFPLQLAPAGGGVLKFTLGIFSNILGVISLFVFTFYLLLERNHLKNILENFLGKKTGSEISNVVAEIEKRLGVWLRGQIVLCFSIGLGTFIGLSLLKVDYALVLSLLAGILEIIPTIGPAVSMIPAVVISLNTSPFLALATAALYFIVQQAENHLLVPNVMRKTTGLSPIVTILSLWIGARLMGFLGMILAVPIVLTIQVLLKEYLPVKK